jgi:hypothetical protein
MSKQKRIALTVSPFLDEVLTELSDLTGQPKTGIIIEILNDSQPIFIQVIKAIKEAKEGHLDLAIKTTSKFIGDAQVVVSQAHLDLGELKGTLKGKK